MKYKVGDYVRIKSLDWYNKNKDSNGNVVVLSKVSRFSWCENVRTVFTKDMTKFCGKVVTIKTVWTVNYSIVEGTNIYYFTDEMIEGLVEETKFGTASNPIEPKSNANSITQSEVDVIEKAKNYWDSIKDAWICPDGYQFVDENGNIINATKIVLEKKNIIREEQIDNAAQEYIDSDNAVLTYSDGFCEQTDHPFVRAAFKAGVEWADNNVTQDDCSKAPKLTSQDYSNGRFGYQLPAGFKAKLTERELILTPEKPEYPKSLLDCENVLNGVRNDRKKLLHKFNELLVARDAYWKIAGEEMGLGKPWKPDWNDGKWKWCMSYSGNYIEFDQYKSKHHTLAFPTAEMRDVFYENFKEFINEVKELL